MKKQPRWSCLLLGVALTALALAADIQNKGPAQHLLYRPEQPFPIMPGYPRHQPTGLINGAARTSLFQPTPGLSITLP